jgi:hypothetical protein
MGTSGSNAADETAMKIRERNVMETSSRRTEKRTAEGRSVS